MSRDKQIEEMAKIIGDNTEQDTMWGEIYDSANAIYDAGYRKASEVARGIFADLEKIIEVDNEGKASFDIREFHHKIEKKYTEEGK